MNFKNAVILVSVCTSVLFSSFTFATTEAVIGPVALKENINIASLVPTTEQSEIIISRDQYVISYNKQRNAPNWVAWKLEANQMGSAGRSNDFEPDSDLEKYLVNQGDTYKAISPEDYRGSCFDRGHQVPSADRTDTVVNNQATFLMSNMIPQTAHLNRVIWEHLERYTRDLVQNQGKKVYVMAGPIYDEDFGSIGLQKNILVPSKDFKVIIVLDAKQNLSDLNENTQIISVIMPNLLSDGSKPTDKNKLCAESVATEGIDATPASDNDWLAYKVSLQDIEKAAKIKFVPSIIK